MSARHRTRDGASTIVMLRDEVTLPAAMHLTQRLGKYTITDTLGEGAMGVVYRALDPHIDRVVAIKTIRKHLLDGPNGHHDAALRFRNEARAAGRLTHPGIVSIYDYGEENGQGYIVMQYVEGASLLRGTASPADRLPLADVLSVATQLLHALNYAHAHGVWHRDIKPSNLIVTAGGQLKITDFGIARIDAHALTQDATVMGSTGYMAPECYQGVELDQRVDIFACGVLLYELLTGCRPFKGVPGAVMHQMLYEEMPSLVATARDDAEAVLLAPFEPIVACAMAKDRSRRYPGAQEMLDALTAVAGKTVAARVSVAAVQALMAPRAAARTQVAAASPAQAATSNVPSAAPTATAPAAPLAADAAPTDAAATLPAADPMATPARIHMLPRKPQPIHRRVDADGAVATPSPESAVAIEAAPTVQAEAPAVVPVTLQAAVPVPAASVPPATTPPAAMPGTFDPAALASLESLLIRTIGPVARVVVRRAAAKHTDLAALVASVAAELPSADASAEFIAQARQALGSAAIKPARVGEHVELATAVSTRGSTPLDDSAVQRAQVVLTQQIGPIARVLVTRARAQATSREQFVSTLAELAADCADPVRLREALERATR